MKLSSLKDFVLDLIFPKECLGCHQEGTYLCNNCFDKISINKDNYCTFCKQAIGFNQICQACQSQTKLKNVFVIADYNNTILQDLLHSFKYKLVEGISDNLAMLVKEYLKQNKVFLLNNINDDNTVLVPVPLHKKRFLKRGFNQSYLLAKEIEKHFEIKIIDLLKRKINTSSQVNMTRQERLVNLKDAFDLESAIELDKNKNIILVDDVITTGSTLNECAYVLNSAGFENIYALVIAQRDS
jgi:ComF family protein